MLLSEMKDAGLIDECGLFSKIGSKLKKVLKTTAGKVGTIATVAACAAVGAVCAVVPGGQLVTAACIGVAVGAVGGAVTAAAATYQADGAIDWEAVGICAGVGALVGGVASGFSYKFVSAIKSMFPKASPSGEVKRFDSYSKFKKEFGKASDYVENGEWHHIVEQQTVKNGINAGPSVYNTQNTVAIPHELHVKISGYYSSKYASNMTVRQYVNTLSYDKQYEFGIKILQKYAAEMGITPVWL